MTEFGIGDRMATLHTETKGIAPASPGVRSAVENAQAWKKWHRLFEQGAQRMSAQMLALSGIAAGSRVLDVGTGLGDPALAAAAIVGQSGRVLAIDPDREMIKLAQERVAAMKIGNVDLRDCRVEDLAAPQSAFDAILCRWSLMFVEDLRATLARLRTMLCPGGRLVAATWCQAQDVPFLSLARWTIHRHFGAPPPPQGPKMAFALRDAALVADTLRDAGFVEVTQEVIALEFEFADPEAYFDFRTDWNGDQFSQVPYAPEIEKPRAMAAIAEAMQPYLQPSGHYRLPGRSVCTAASNAKAQDLPGRRLSFHFGRC
jgi:ubiquinone/menaquinone biosynthesis C-methylase UbiE